MTRVDFAMGGAISISLDRHRPSRPLVNIRAVGRSGTVLLFTLHDHEVLKLIRALIANGEGKPLDVVEVKQADVDRLLAGGGR